jgi:hypothetical protein
MTSLRGATRATLRSLAVVLAGTAVLAPAAGAAPVWTAPVELSAPGHTAYEQHVAVDPQGNAVAVWQRFNGVVTVVQAATRPAGGTWGPPVDISGTEGSAQLPRVAIDAAGEAVATWDTTLGVNVVQVATLPPGGTWSTPRTISEPGRNSSDPEVAVDAAGDAIVVWEGANGSGTSIAQEASRPAGDTWTVPVKLSAEGQNAQIPAVAISPSGAAVVAWVRNDGSDFIVQASRRAPGGIWTTPLNLSKPGGDAGSPTVAIDPAGDAVVAWRRWDGTHEVVQAVRRSGEAGAWSPTADLSRAEESGYGPTAAIDPAGDATVIWEGIYGNTHGVATADSAAGTDVWSPPAVLSATGVGGFEPALAINSRGDAVAAWNEHSQGSELVRVALRGAGNSAWGAPIDLSSPELENKAPAVAIDPAGDAVTVWRHWDGANSIVDASTFEVGRSVAAEPEPGPGPGAEAPPGTTPAPGTSPSPIAEAPTKAQCPKGKVPRKVKVRVGGGRKARFKTVRKCVKPGAARPKHRHAKHRQTKGK